MSDNITVKQSVNVDVPWSKIDCQLRQWFEVWALSQGGTIPQPKHWSSVHVSLRTGAHGDVSSVSFLYEPATPPAVDTAPAGEG